MHGTNVQAKTVLMRALPVSTPETRLWIDVLVAAISDGRNPKVARAERMDAIKFFSDGRSDLVADAIGLEAEYVREVARKCGVAEGAQG